MNKKSVFVGNNKNERRNSHTSAETHTRTHTHTHKHTRVAMLSCSTDDTNSNCLIMACFERQQL